MDSAINCGSLSQFSKFCSQAKGNIRNRGARKNAVAHRYGPALSPGPGLHNRSRGAQRLRRSGSETDRRNRTGFWPLAGWSSCPHPVRPRPWSQPRPGSNPIRSGLGDRWLASRRRVRRIGAGSPGAQPAAPAKEQSLKSEERNRTGPLRILSVAPCHYRRPFCRRLRSGWFRVYETGTLIVITPTSL